MAAIAPDHASPSHRWCLPPPPCRRECHTTPSVAFLIPAQECSAAGAAATSAVAHPCIKTTRRSSNSWCIENRMLVDWTNSEPLPSLTQAFRPAKPQELPANAKVSTFQRRELPNCIQKQLLHLIYCK